MSSATVALKFNVKINSFQKIGMEKPNMKVYKDEVVSRGSNGLKYSNK